MHRVRLPLAASGLLAAATFAVTFLVALSVPSGARAEIIDRVAVVVNGQPITLSELHDRAGPLPRGRDGEAESRRRRLLELAAEQLVAEKLLSEQVAQEGLSPAPMEIEAAIEDVKRANNLDDETFQRALQQQGLTPKKYRHMLGEQIGRMKLVEMKIRGRVTVTDDDVRARYAQMTRGARPEEEVHARDIFVPKGSDPAAARARIEQARRRLKAGEDFDAVARETGGPFADSGGDLGWFRRGMMVPEIEKTAFALKPGELSQIVEGDTGYHLLRVEERRSIAAIRSFNEAREELRQQILSEKLQSATEDYVAELRKEATVELRLP